MRIEPPRSVPSPAGASRPATAEAVPPLDPPAVRLTSQGLRVVPKMGFVVLTSCANSGVLVLPSTIAPAARRRSTQMESSSGTSCSRIFEPNVVRIPRVKMLSLTTTGTPSSGRGVARAASRRSTASASSRAASFRVQMAFRVGLTASTRASVASTTSRALTLRWPTSRAIRAAERFVMSWSNASLLTIGGAAGMRCGPW